MALTEAQQFTLGKFRSRVKYSVANKTNIPKILLVKLGAVGGLIMATPFFDQLRKHFPHSEIILVVGRSSYAAIEHDPNINRFILVDDFDFYHGGYSSIYDLFGNCVKKSLIYRFLFIELGYSICPPSWQPCL